MNAPDVSIIIVNWNTRDILRDCLCSIYDQTHDVPFEVILIDNASTDGSASMVKSEFAQVMLIENQENRGFAAANNQGIAVAQGRYVLLLNPDTVILEGAIQKTVAFADKQLKAAVIGIRNDGSDGMLVKNCFQFASVQNLVISLLGLHQVFPRSRFFGRERLSWWDYQSIRKVDVVAGCFMLVRQEAIAKVGAMDEAFFMYGEEMDWCWRFRESGWDVLYYPDARIVHYGGMSAAQNPMGMHAASQRSLLYFIEKRQGRWARRVARGLLFSGGLVRLWYWAIRWLVGPARVRSISRQRVRQAFIASFGH